MNIKHLTFFIVICILAFVSCKKNKTESTRNQLSLDSVFLYAKEIYYWNDKLPTYASFNPRQYTSLSTDLLNFEKELFEISKYSNPGEYKAGYTAPKYSYIFDKADKNPIAYVNPVSSVDLEGNGNDVGIRFAIFTYSNDPGYLFFVGAVYPGSPAEAAGLIRGDLIKKINGVSFGTNYNSESSALDKALEASPMTVEVVKTSGVTVTYNLNKTSYSSTPIYRTRVISVGSKKIGYLSYARFSNAEAILTSAINDFASSGVTDLIVDLRYNGGGYVGTAEHLINLLAPSTASGVMFTEYFNATMQAGNAKILANQPLLEAGKIKYSNGKMLTYADVDYSVSKNVTNFSKKGNLNNLGKIVFLVSRSTASASELVINSLKPVADVSLVGATTYGKPIGFFPVTIENKYDVYFSLFETKNARGEGGYFDGIAPTVPASELVAGTSSYIMYDFGDVRDGLVKQAINIISPSSSVSNREVSSVSTLNKSIQVNGNDRLSQGIVDREFKGMIENRLKLKN